MTHLCSVYHLSGELRIGRIQRMTTRADISSSVFQRNSHHEQIKQSFALSHVKSYRVVASLPVCLPVVTKFNVNVNERNIKPMGTLTSAGVNREIILRLCHNLILLSFSVRVSLVNSSERKHFFEIMTRNNSY